jgi:hypothetical protein
VRRSDKLSGGSCRSGDRHLPLSFLLCGILLAAVVLCPFA